MQTAQILIAVGVVSSTFCMPSASMAKPKQHKSPNIIYILADDLGYGDISVNNPDSKILTPNIDRLASQGIRFTDAHSPSAVCTPTRYGILTGRYAWRSPLKSGVLNGYSQPLIERDRTTVASFLKNNGYTTAVVGKWHLGLGWVQKENAGNRPEANPSSPVKAIHPEQLDFSFPPTDGPLHHGFDYSYILPASLDMPPYCYLENGKLTAPLTEQTPGNNPDNGTTGAFWREGLMAAGFDFELVTPTFMQKAVSYIKKQASSEKPFFLYLPFPSPHTPWLPLPKYNGTSKAGQYGDFVQMVDAQVGEIMETLTEMGLDDNTIVFFTSDNGPFWKPQFIEEFDHRATSIYRGMKADAYEGGHRIPLIVRWPGKIKSANQCAEPVSLTGLLATCAGILTKELSGKEGEDSFSILPLLLDNPNEYVRPEALIQHSSKGIFVVRQGNWKLILGLGSGGFSKPEYEEAKESGPAGQLYNLKEDPSETNNVYLEYPAKVAELNSTLKKYQETGRSRE
ncbi:MAG: arylsulfatase [Prolixibacteraceae bacterium]